jgi:hypothetical protein
MLEAKQQAPDREKDNFIEPRAQAAQTRGQNGPLDLLISGEGSSVFAQSSSMFYGQCPSLRKFGDSIVAAKNARPAISQAASQPASEAAKTPPLLVGSKPPAEPDPVAAPRADVSKILTPEIVNASGPSVRP